MTSEDRDTDMRLQAALRHAPDAEVAPPPALDRRILDAARRAVPGPGAKPAGRWFGWLDILTRPAGAAAFASLLLGTTIALLWRGEVPPEAMPGAPAQDRAAATLPSTPERRAAEPASVASAAAPAAVTTTVATDATPPASAAYRARTAKVAPQPSTPSPAVRVDNTVEPEVAAREAAPMPTPVMAAAPAPPPNPSIPDAPARDASAAAGQTAMPAPAGAAMRSAARPSVKMEQASAHKSAQPAPAPDPVAPMLAALADAPATMQVLRELQRAAQGRWMAVSASLPAAGDLLVRDASGRTLARLRLDADGVIWQSLATPEGGWRATLDAGTVQTLRDRWSSSGGVTEPPPTTQPGR